MALPSTSMVLVGPQAAANLESIEIGQHDVEQHEVRAFPAQVLQAFLAAAEAIQMKTLFLKVVADELHDIRFVLDDHDARWHTLEV